MKRIVFILLCVLLGFGFGMLWVKRVAIWQLINSSMAGRVDVVEGRSSDDVREVVEVVEIPFKTQTKTTTALREGTSSVVQKGVPGEKTVHYMVIYKDGKETERKFKFERITKKAVDEVTVRGTLVAP